MRTLILIALGAGLMVAPETVTHLERQSAPVLDCDTDAECAALPPCALKPGCDGTPWTEPYRLVGYGCEGAGGVLYADEEDHFPRCRRIEPTFGR
jgi:hypothetical protein